MPAKKRTEGRYVVLRDFGQWVAGDRIDLDDDQAALMIRDGMVRPADEEGEA